MQFRVLGPLEVLDGGQPIDVSAPKQRALLLLLLVRGGTVVSTDAILDTLWPDEAPAAGVKTVRFHISKLRKTLAGAVAGSGSSVIKTRGNGYAIDIDHHDVDARTFETLVDAGCAEIESRPDRARRLLSEALGMWRGPAYYDVEYEDFAQSEARRLGELRLAAVERRIAAELRLGRSLDVVGELEALVAEHPERERPTELLMQALYSAGRSADAIVAARALRDRLGEIGLEPQPSLATLEDQILRHNVPTAPTDTPVDSRGKLRLPTPLTSFIGRSVEIGDVKTLVRNGRLVTLVGSPGSGKTRLGLELARELASDYTHGAVMVELSEVADPDLVPQAVSTALGIRAPLGADYTELIVAALRSQESLVLLDNCEHVVGKAARLVLSILQACSRVTIVATSREALGVPGERVWPVPPFALPPTSEKPVEELLQIDSIRLFVDRAREIYPGFVADASNLDAVETVCRHLDGLPLAIELAASTVEALTPQQIAERLEQRFVEAPSGWRPGLAHQATIEDAVRWSYDLLDTSDQTIFSRLSVFAGGFSMEAAEAIAGWGDIDKGEVFDSVLRLVHKSLLVPMTNVLSGVRYRMLTVLRQFGARILLASDEAEEIDRLHALYYANLADSLAPHFQGPLEASTRAVADLELDNFRHALDSSLGAGREEVAMQITSSLTWYWYWSSYVTEALGWARRALDAASEASSPQRAHVLYTVGLFENIAGNYVAASATFGESRAIAADLGMRSLEAASLTGLGVSLRDRGQLAGALEHFQLAVATDREIQRHPHLALSLRFVASVNFMLGKVSEAVRQAAESYEIFEELGHKGGMGWALETQCRITSRKDRRGALELAARARELYAEVHDRRNDAWVLIDMAEMHTQDGSIADARADADQSLEIFVELNDKRGIGYAVLRSGQVHLADRQFDQAGADLRRALRLFIELGDEGGASTTAGFLAGLAVSDGDGEGATGHAERWLSVPAADRYTWGFLDVLRQLVEFCEEAGRDSEALSERLAGFESALLEGADMEAAGKTLNDIPTVLAAVHE